MLQTIGKIIVACIVSAGGIGGIIIASISFSSGIIAKKLSQKYEYKLEQTLERYKTELSKKEYISKTRFDAEFNLYRNLSQKFSQMVMEIETAIFEDSHKGKTISAYHRSRAVECAKNAVDELYAAAPFIKEEIYDELAEIYDMCREQCVEYEKMSEEVNIDNETYLEVVANNRKIKKRYGDLMGEIRDYTMKLDVMA